MWGLPEIIKLNAEPKRDIDAYDRRYLRIANVLVSHSSLCLDDDKDRERLFLAIVEAL